MEVSLVANQFNLVVKEENAENECVVLHYEDEHRPTKVLVSGGQIIFFTQK